MLVRPMVSDAGNLARSAYPGDIIAGGENILAGGIATAGAGVWTGAAIAAGIIRRTGPGAGYTDTTDTATNIIAALKGNAGCNVVPGSTFRTLFINTVAQAMTFAAGTGVVAGTGTLNCAASLVREYLWTILNASDPQTLQCNTTNASALVTFVLPSGASSLPLMASNGPIGAAAITPGMTVSGTGITAGTTVIGITMGQGGMVGVTLSAVATATSAVGGVALSFGPTVQIDSLRSTTL
jgi:hypothetical protein